MEDNFPVPITNENDLSIYEHYLNQNTLQKPYTPETLTNPIFLPAYLKNHIGKLVKVEALIGDCLQSRIGTLMEIGADFITIKLSQSCRSMVIEGKCIKFITIIHDNNNNDIWM